MKTLDAHLRLFNHKHAMLAVLLQVLLLVLLCGACNWLVATWKLPLPGSVLALGLLLVSLSCGLLPAASIKRGADWLLGDMLLFFIPAVMAVSRHMELLRHDGLRIVAVILLGTLAVMASTALLVDLVFRLGNRHAR